MAHTTFTSLEKFPKEQRMAELRRLAEISRLVNADQCERSRAADSHNRRERLIPQMVAAFLNHQTARAIAMANDVPLPWLQMVLRQRISIETRRKRDRAMATRYERERQRQAKGIAPDRYQIRTPVRVGGKDFDSISDAARYYGVPVSTLHAQIRGRKRAS